MYREATQTSSLIFLVGLGLARARVLPGLSRVTEPKEERRPIE